jgi:hypothetical protein
MMMNDIKVQVKQLLLVSVIKDGAVDLSDGSQLSHLLFVTRLLTEVYRMYLPDFHISE